MEQKRPEEKAAAVKTAKGKEQAETGGNKKNYHRTENRKNMADPGNNEEKTDTDEKDDTTKGNNEATTSYDKMHREDNQHESKKIEQHDITRNASMIEGKKW